MTPLAQLAAAATTLDNLLAGGFTDPDRNAAIASAVTEVRIRMMDAIEWLTRLADDMARAIAATQRRPKEN